MPVGAAAPPGQVGCGRVASGGRRAGSAQFEGSAPARRPTPIVVPSVTVTESVFSKWRRHRAWGDRPPLAHPSRHCKRRWGAPRRAMLTRQMMSSLNWWAWAAPLAAIWLLRSNNDRLAACQRQARSRVRPYAMQDQNDAIKLTDEAVPDQATAAATARAHLSTASR